MVYPIREEFSEEIIDVDRLKFIEKDQDLRLAIYVKDRQEKGLPLNSNWYYYAKEFLAAVRSEINFREESKRESTGC